LTTAIVSAAAIGAAVLYVAYRPLFGGFTLPYSPKCVEGVFSEVRQKDSRPSPYRLRKDRPFAGYAPLAPPLSYYCYVCRGGVFPFPPSLYREG